MVINRLSNDIAHGNIIIYDYSLMAINLLYILRIFLV